ncbi:MAG: Gfo/Idh/MocA family oxidoreductase [Defluviitaleaceae bacterium]|nr:Gfo/Idh/MocA family oxidoreductase [Defluviitaleaceae bacterium]
MEKRKKIGIIGVGGISAFHIENYLKNERVELYAFCDVNEAQLHKMAVKYGIKRTYPHAAQMLADLPELDAVSVCTWNSAHAPCVIAALDAGKDVLCEKPMALTLQESLEMQAAAKKSGKLLMIGFVRRFGKDCKIVNDFIESGMLGDVYYAKAVYLRRHGCPGGWFGDKSRAGGGPLIDLGVHVIDMTRYLMGNPKPVSVYGATYQKLRDRPGVKDVSPFASISKSDNDIFDVEDLAVALIRYDNGAVLNLETSFSLNIKDDRGYVELMGDKGGVRIGNEVDFYTNINGYLSNIDFGGRAAVDFNENFTNEINHFIDCITKGVPCQSPMEDGVELMRILDTIYRSAKSGHEELL